MFHTFDICTPFYLNYKRYLIVISVPFKLQLLKVASIYGVRLKKQQILETHNYFDCKLQTSNDKSVRLVYYSPRKRESLQQAFASQSPVN